MASPKITCVLLMCMVVLSAPIAQAAITCPQVESSLAQCVGYLRGVVRIPPPGCCGGLRSLNSAARTTADRRAACSCLQKTAKIISGLKFDLAAGLPGKCGFSVPYKISPSTNCNTIS